MDVITNGQLDQKTNAELVAIYNELHPEKPVRRFESHAAGIRRILVRLAERQAALPAEEQPPVRNMRPEPKEGWADKKRPLSERKAFNYPVGAIREHKPGTKRAQVLEMLLKGMTLEQVMKEIGWPYRTAFEGVKLIHKDLGYGLTEGEDGIIRAVRS